MVDGNDVYIIAFVISQLIATVISTILGAYKGRWQEGLALGLLLGWLGAIIICFIPKKVVNVPCKFCRRPIDPRFYFCPWCGEQRRALPE